MRAPTETSMPPTRITRVCPSATIIRGAACLRMLSKLVVLRKSGEMRVETTTSKSRITHGPTIDWCRRIVPSHPLAPDGASASLTAVTLPRLLPSVSTDAVAELATPSATRRVTPAARRTAIRTMIPLITIWVNEDTPARFITLLRIEMIATPPMVPPIPPRPPVRAVPPRTTAAIESQSKPTPESGSPAPMRIDMATPARAARKPQAT